MQSNLGPNPLYTLYSRGVQKVGNVLYNALFGTLEWERKFVAYHKFFPINQTFVPHKGLFLCAI